MLPATRTLDIAAVTANCALPGAASQVVAESAQDVIPIEELVVQQLLDDCVNAHHGFAGLQSCCMK